MEKTNLDENKKDKEIQVIHKGLFYYIFQLLFLPFKLLKILFKLSLKYVNIYLGWLKEYKSYKSKKKSLNKILSISKLRDEIL